MLDACELSPSYIRAIAAYQPGKPTSDLAREMGLEEATIVKLASNENPLGTSALAHAAISAQLPELARYPDGNGFDLKQALCAHYRVRPEQLVLGSGSNDVLELVARAFLAAGTSSVFSQHAFVVYPLATQAVGATAVEVPAKAFGHDLPAMAAAVREELRSVGRELNNPPELRAGGRCRRAGVPRGSSSSRRGLPRVPARRAAGTACALERHPTSS
jgi:histidinol-phosphate aminotransferase